MKIYTVTKYFEAKIKQIMAFLPLLYQYQSRGYVETNGLHGVFLHCNLIILN